MSSLIISDRVVETSTTTGTGALTLAGAVTGYRAFSAAMSVGDTCYYTIEAIDASGNPTGDWETGLGTYSAASTLTRTTVRASSNAGAAVSFAAGAKRVFLNMIASAVIPVASDGSATITGPGITLRYTSASSGFTVTDRSDSPGHQVNFVSNAPVTGGGAVMNIFSAASSATSKNISQISLWTVNPLTEVSSVQSAIRGVAGTSGEELHLITQRFGTTALTAGDILFKPNATERFRVTSAGATVTGDLTATGNVTVADDAYDATTWNGSTQVPTKNAVRDKIEALASGAMALIAEVTTSASQASVSFSSIAATYRDLVLVVRGRGTAAVANVNLQLQFNGDTAANYEWSQMEFQGATNFSGGTTGVTQIVSGVFPGTVAPALAPGLMEAVIYDYRGTTFHKGTTARNGAQVGTGNTVFEIISYGRWKSTAAINAILVFLSSGNFVDGTVVSLYGRM